MPLSLLAEVYRNRWEEMRRLNELDQRSLVMFGSAMTAVVLASPHALALPAIVLGTTSVIAAIVCLSSMYSTIRNRLGLENCLATINQIETEFNKRFPGLFPRAQRYSAPKTRAEFARRVLLSIRGPIVVLFTAGLGGSLFLGLEGIIATDEWHAIYISLAVAISSSALLCLLCFWANYRSAEDDFRRINASTTLASQEERADAAGTPRIGDSNQNTQVTQA